jgi:hypothetical protein
MKDLTLTRHAELRMRQRGLRDSDLSLLFCAATPLGGDAYLMTNADAEREIAQRKREIQQIERLRGLKVIVPGDVVVTIYRPSHARRRRASRRGKRSDVTL